MVSALGKEVSLSGSLSLVANRSDTMVLASFLPHDVTKVIPSHSVFT